MDSGFRRDRSATEARRDAHLYLVGMTAAFLGGSSMVLAAGIWVKSLTGSSALAALVSVCIYAPSTLGLLADRVRRQRLLVMVNGATAVIARPRCAGRAPGPAVATVEIAVRSPGQPA